MRILFALLFIAPLQAFETSSDEISIDLNSSICILNGNAEVKYGENVFKADSVTIEYISKALKKPKRIEAKNVNFYNKDIFVKANYCKFDMICIEFYDNVIIQNPEFGKVIADRAEYNLKTKKATITSKDKVKLKIKDKKLGKIGGGKGIKIKTFNN